MSKKDSLHKIPRNFQNFCLFADIPYEGPVEGGGIAKNNFDWNIISKDSFDNRFNEHQFTIIQTIEFTIEVRSDWFDTFGKNYINDINNMMMYSPNNENQYDQEYGIPFTITGGTNQMKGTARYTDNPVNLDLFAILMGAFGPSPLEGSGLNLAYALNYLKDIFSGLFSSTSSSDEGKKIGSIPKKLEHKDFNKSIEIGNSAEQEKLKQETIEHARKGGNATIRKEDEKEIFPLFEKATKSRFGDNYRVQISWARKDTTFNKKTYHYSDYDGAPNRIKSGPYNHGDTIYVQYLYTTGGFGAPYKVLVIVHKGKYESFPK